MTHEWSRGSYFCRETARRPSTVGSFRMPHVEAAAAAISLGQRAAAAAVDGRACRDNSCGVSDDKARVCAGVRVL